MAIKLRDEVMPQMTAEGAATEAIEESDRWLKNSAVRWTAIGNECKRLRELFNPNASEWWWQLDQVPQELRLGWLPGAIAALSISATFAVLASVSSRWLSHGPETYTILATVSQTVLAAGSGFALTNTGRTWVGRAFSRHGIPLALRPWALIFALLVILGAACGLRGYLPRIAKWYFADAGAHYDVKEINDRNASLAILEYQIAESLDPTYADPHAKLADIYVDMQRLDDAEQEYKTAISLAPSQLGYVANLARIDFMFSPPKVDDAVGRVAELLIRKQNGEIPNFPQSKSELSRLSALAFYYRSHDVEQAILFIKDALHAMPDSSENNAVYAMLLSALPEKSKTATDRAEIDRRWTNTRDYWDDSSGNRVLLFDSLEYYYQQARAASAKENNK